VTYFRTKKPKRARHFTDSEVCKYYICGFCPHELFTNTKSDLGACPHIHDDACKDEFQRSSKKNTYPYEADFVAYLEHLIGDLDRKIRRSHERLDQDKDEEPESPPIDTELAAKIAAISEREKALIDQMETLGEEGKIDELQNVKKHVDQLKQEKERLMSGQRPGQEKRMKVCEVCGAFLVIGDTEKRQQSHLEGKQHQGYLKIRQTIDEFKKLIDDRRRGRPEENNRDRSKPSNSRSKSPRGRDRRRDKHRHRSSSRDKSKERDRSKDNKNKEKRRERDEDDEDDELKREAKRHKDE